jgi:hypothetical protein
MPHSINGREELCRGGGAGKAVGAGVRGHSGAVGTRVFGEGLREIRGAC